MMMDTTVDVDGKTCMCPECSFVGKSLPELISHLNEAHSEETASKSEAPPKNLSSLSQPEKRSRRKPAFSHQIVSQAPRSSPVFARQQTPANINSDSSQVLNRSTSLEKAATKLVDDSSIPIISDENTNININAKESTNSTSIAQRNPNVLHSILSLQRPIAPKNGSPTATKITPVTSPAVLPMINSPSNIDNPFYSPINQAMQPYKKNFQCKMCRLTYKNFHDCTAHIRKKHEISHAQAGRYVDKLDEDAPLPPSATGNYKFRIKGKSLPPPHINPATTIKRTSLTPTMNDDTPNMLQCKYCTFMSTWPKEILQHQHAMHPDLQPHIVKKDYSSQDNKMHEEEDDGVSALIIDPVRTFGEVVSPADHDDGNEHESVDSQDESMMMEHEADDDEDDALWKYQQEMNNTNDSDTPTVANDNTHTLSASFPGHFKRFRCPHCEHSSPTLTKLKLHIASHINIKPFMCSICGWRANLRWYIQCHAKKRHPNMDFEILQLSNEEAEQTIKAYMKERGLDSKLNANGQDPRRYFQCSLCQFRASHPKFIEQHIATVHPNKSYAKMIVNKPPQGPPPQTNNLNVFNQVNGNNAMKQSQTNNLNDRSDRIYSKFMIKPPAKSYYQRTNGDSNKYEMKTQALYNRSSLIQSDGTMIIPDASQVVYPKFSSHANFNPNRLFYCALCLRGYRWRYDVKRHHKTTHETPEDEAALGLSMSPKSVKRRNKEFNRNFRYLEYVPQLDGLISASMSSGYNHYAAKHEGGGDVERIPPSTTDDDDDDEGEENQDSELRLSLNEARTVDITEDEAAALLMIEPQASDTNTAAVSGRPEEAVIVFDEDRRNLSDIRDDKSPIMSNETSRLSVRTPTGFKPYCCPYCFYRTNWRTDSLRHIRARHKIEPAQDGYYEMPPDEAERTFAEYERTFGFVVSKKVLGRFTDFRHIEWKDLQRSIWEQIKDKQGFESIIYERLRPHDYTEATNTKTNVPLKQTTSPILYRAATLAAMKAKRKFACMECAFSSQKLVELEKHICARIQKPQQEKPHGKCLVSLYQCTKCCYRTMYNNYARKHIHLHRLKTKTSQYFYYCSFCGYNHNQRNRIIVHIAKSHSTRNMSTTTVACRRDVDADFSIQQIYLRRSFIESQINNDKSIKARVFYCIHCPHVSTSILEYNHHQSCHQHNSAPMYKCNHCSFASDSLLYTRQHNLLHSKSSRLLSIHIDTKNLKHLPVSNIFRQTLGKKHRYRCPFCRNFSSGASSTVLKHIKNNHTGNSNRFDDSLIIGSDAAKEILSFKEETMTDNQLMDTS